MNDDIASRIWITYRKNFPAIGGTGPTCDQGWGCMLRCGQMMLAQALVCRHLGRDWSWTRQRRDENYTTILKSFLDRKDAVYSIHQIAQMGVGEGKKVGQWFGPNTVAQVIKKLALFDEWSDLMVHVAMDNTVVIEDIKKLCKSQKSSWKCYGSCSYQKNRSSGSSSSAFRSAAPATPSCSCVEKPPVERNASQTSTSSEGEVFTKPTTTWAPLLLFIPLRLGLTEINPDYYPSLKAMFTLKQSLGVIGGKPNHAHYFIG